MSLSVSTGNEATHGIEDFIEHLLASTSSRVLPWWSSIFEIRSGFFGSPTQARERDVVLVMLHPGRSNAARQSAQTHTGALAGDYDVMRTMVERAGVMVADTLEELVDVSDCMMRCGALPFGGVAILSESGAYKALALDHCDGLGMVSATAARRRETALNAIAPG